MADGEGDTDVKSSMLKSAIIKPTRTWRKLILCVVVGIITVAAIGLPVYFHLPDRKTDTGASALNKTDTGASALNKTDTGASALKNANRSSTVPPETSSKKPELPLLCIYNTPQDMMRNLTKDPFGDMCNVSSKYVQNFCYGEETSSHMCLECSPNLTLPSYCFCDRKIHCEKIPNFKPRDDARHKCSECHSFFKVSKFSSRGSCYCQDNKPIQCNCKDGYDNFMCVAISKRLCERTDVKTNNSSELCYNSNSETCFLDFYICNSFNTVHDGLNLSQIPECEQQ